jgi:hypothetical protein
MKYAKVLVVVFALLMMSGFSRPVEAASTTADSAKLQELLALLSQLQAQLAQLQQDEDLLLSLEVTSPVGKEIFSEDDMVSVTWKPNGSTQPGIKKIELVPTKGSKTKTLFSTSRNDSAIFDGYYDVQLPRPTTSGTGAYYKIRITDTGGRTDLSDSFRINKKG